MYNCRMCGGLLEELLDFGMQPLANRLVTDPAKEEKMYHGIWGWCPRCAMLQLADPPSMRDMFTGDYPYLTDSSNVMVAHFDKTAKELVSRIGLNGDSLVVEIGANTGGILEHLGCYTFAFEPSDACRITLKKKRISNTGMYFGEDTAKIPVDNFGKPVDLIYSANTLRSIPDLGNIFRGVKKALSADGYLVFEEPYLPDILRANALDQFYDENVWCFTVQSVDWLAKRFGMTLVEVQHLDTHGGSMRYFLQNGTRQQDESVRAWGAGELFIDIHVRAFMDNAKRVSREFRHILLGMKQDKKRVVGYGATAKSSTMLNFVGIDTDLISVIYDTSPTKWGKYTAGTHIPIKNAEDFKNDDADLVVLFAWNHAREIVGRENSVRNRAWLVYVPEVKFL